jgi:hypothetical protein
MTADLQREMNPELGSSSVSTETWRPSFWVSVLWTILATIMTVVGFVIFRELYALIRGGIDAGGAFVEYGTDGQATYFSVSLGGFALLMLGSLGVLVIHEAIHAAGFRMFGGRPIVGAMIIQKILPVFYCSAPGFAFSKAQFSVIILGPLIVISLAGIALMPFIDDWIVLVVPLAVNFGGAVGDLWMFGMTMRRPTGTRIEDLKDGLRFYYPEAAIR